MKIRQQKHNRKLIIAVIVAIVLVGGVTATALVLKHNQTKPTNQAAKTDKSDKTKSTDSQSSKEEESGSDKTTSQPSVTEDAKKQTPQYDGQGTANDPANSKTITRGVSYKQIRGDTLYVTATVNQTVPSGDATMRLTGPNGQTVQVNTDLYHSPSGATELAFSVPVAQLGNSYGGKWTIKITINNNDYSGDITDTVDL